MKTRPHRLFLDTNVYIIGSADASSPESIILHWAEENQPEPLEVVVSEQLFKQIRRVARRLRNKDWAGEILAQISHDLNLRYTLVEVNEIERIAQAAVIPTEDIEVYLTARNGQADCFVSANHELIRALVRHTGEFECLTPADFVAKYIQPR